jgi:pyruvate, water dikinase
VADAGVEYGRPLAGLRRADEPRFGGKSACLGELLSAGLNVPPGFALSSAAFRAFIEEGGLEPRIPKAIESVPSGDFNAVESAARAIGEAMRSAPVPHFVREEIARRYAELAEAEGVQAPPVAVRSSALGEDSTDATFAGQQTTCLWVRGTEQVCDAVRECWISLYSAPAISYRAKLGHPPERIAMGVTIQQMVDAEVSGVMFTCNPVSGDPSVVAVNASWGLGLAVVGGEVTPDDYLVSKVTSEVVREQVNRKEVQYVAAAQCDRAVRVEVPVRRRDVACLGRPALLTLVDVARRVERHFGCHQDIEWVIARDGAGPDSLFVVQSRPVTGVTKPQPAPPPRSAIALVMSTFGADRARGDS